MPWMDRPQVAAHYRAKGYRVHESMVVEGPSGNHRIPMLCEGPLGNLTVFFGDAGGIDGPEIGAAKRIARDLGATAVVAAAQFTGAQREAAAELGVVLLDDAVLAAPASAPTPAPASVSWPTSGTPREVLERDLAAHPWPDSGRPGGFDGPSRNVMVDVDEILARFDKPAQPMPPLQAPRAAPTTPQAAPTPGIDGGPTPQRATVSSTISSTAPSTAATSLWKHPRAGAQGPRTTPAAPNTTPTPLAPTGATGAAGATRFTWLNLPKVPEAAPDAEYEETLSGRSPVSVQTPDPHLVAMRALRRRKLVRATAWVAGAAVVLYLFLLWWF